MTKKIFDESFDFGFTTVSEIDFKTRELLAAADADVRFAVAQAKVEKIYKMIMPLLLNLKKDADNNEYIYWPDRSTKIDEFITILDNLVNS